MSAGRRGLVGFVCVVGIAAVVSTTGAQPGVRKPPPPMPHEALPPWPGHAATGAVTVHAVDADGEALRGALVARDVAWVTTPVERRVTGRVTAKDRKAALAALVAHEPALAFTPSRLRRGGRLTVDLDFRRAPTRDLFRLFADVMRMNIVVLAPSSDLTIRVRRVAAATVLAEIVRAAGLAMDRPASNVIVVREASRARVRRLPTGGGALTLDTRAAPAGYVLALLQQLELVDSVDDGASCTPGDAIDLRLRRVATKTAAALVALVGNVTTTAPRCTLTELTGRVDPAKVRLLAVVARGGTRLALVDVDGQGVRYIVDRAPWRIGESFASFEDASGTHSVQLHPGGLTDSPAPSTAPSLRLAATIIDGDSRLALVDVDGVPHIWDASRPVRVRDDWATISIAPGEVRIGDDEVLQLAPRKQP